MVGIFLLNWRFIYREDKTMGFFGDIFGNNDGSTSGIID
jgi:hypothetical protein